MTRPKVAVTDDWQDISRQCADWSALEKVADVTWFCAPFASEAEAAKALAEFDVILPLRDRTKFPASLLRQLPRLRLIAQTGVLTLHIDVDYCNARGIAITGAGAKAVNYAATPELTLGLMLSAAHHIARGEANLRAGKFQESIPFGEPLAGKTLGIVGLGKIGTRMARYGNALDMTVLAWSPNLTPERAQAAGARMVSKDELFAQSDVVTLHLTHSEKTTGIITGADFARMKDGALFVNTARGALIDEAALLSELKSGRLSAALDVYEQEPLPLDHPFRSLPNLTMTPHLGFIKRDAFEGFYMQSVENVLSFISGAPQRVLNPEHIQLKAS